MRRLLVVTGVAVTVLLGVASPAFAHVSLTPQSAPAGRLQLYTVQVPNELPDQATVEIDVTLPAGFVLDVAQSVPGWSTVITRRAGTPVAVAWKAGRIPVGTFASFQIQGRNPPQQGSIRWPTVQRYERTTVTWNGAATAEDAAPYVRLVAPGTTLAGGVDGSPPVPLSTGEATDQLARSRAALGIALALLALGLVLGPLSVGFLRRRGAATLHLPTDTASPASAARPGARPVAPGATPRAPARSGRSSGPGA